MKNYFQKIIPIGFVRQANKNYCGPACVEMILHHLGRRSLNQRKIYDENHSFQTIDPTVAWGSPPDAMVSILNKLIPPKFGGHFKLIAEQNIETVAMNLISVISRLNIPGIALVHDGHWVVVHGYQLNKNPRGPKEKTHAIKAMWIRDPLHNYYHIILWNIWKSNYVDGPVPSGKWQGKYIAICDPAKKSKAKKLLPGIYLSPGNKSIPSVNTTKIIKSSLPLSKGMITPKIHMAKITPLKKKLVNHIGLYKLKKYSPLFIKPNQAAAFASLYLHNKGYHEMPFLKKALAQIKAGKATITRSMHKKNDYYYIVPMLSEKEGIHSLVSVSATLPEFREAIFIADKNEPMSFKPLSRSGILDAILKFLIDDTGKKSTLKQDTLKFLQTAVKIKKKRKELLMKIDHTLVWKPCLQTSSPFRPFHRVVIKQRTFYVMLDGGVFNRLTKGCHD
jgi:Peptidase_C39 like family